MSSKWLLKKHNKGNHLKYLACEHRGERFKEVQMVEVHINLHNSVQTIVVNFSFSGRAVKP